MKIYKKSKGEENLWRTETDPGMSVWYLSFSSVFVNVIILFLSLFPGFYFFHSFFHRYLLNTHSVSDTMLNMAYIAVKEIKVGLAHVELIVYWGRKVLSKYLHEWMSDYILCFALWRKMLGCWERCRGDRIQICELLNTPFEMRFKFSSEGYIGINWMVTG